jgi:hypothetical protein
MFSSEGMEFYPFPRAGSSREVHDFDKVKMDCRQARQRDRLPSRENDYILTDPKGGRRLLLRLPRSFHQD